MNRLLLLYNLLLAVVVLDAIASAFVAAYIFRLRERFGQYLAMAFTAVAAEAMIAVVTTGAGPTPQRIVAWVVALRILARLFKTATMGALALYLLGYLNGVHLEGKNNAK